MSYWDNALEGAKEESGGGVVGLGRIDLAYFCFVSGFAGDERGKCLFIPKDGTKDARAVTRKAAQDFIVENGGEVRDARWCSVTTLYKDKCSRGGEPVIWDYDRLETVPIWPYRANPDQPGGAKLVIEQNERLGVPGGEDFWGRFVWAPDPYKESLGEAGKTKEDQKGNMVYPKICLVAQVFENKAEAKAYIGTAETASSSESEAWDDETWDALLPEIADEIIGGKGKAAVARDYGVPLAEMIKRLKAAENDIPY